MQQVNAEGQTLIKSFESCKLKAYWDALARVWTIGWGHTGPYVTEGLVITQDLADSLFLRDLAAAQSIVEDAVKVLLNTNQYAALCSFVYNVGPGRTGAKDGFVHLANGQPSSMLRYLNEKSFSLAAAEFPKWDHAGGVVSSGLLRRRMAEQALFQKNSA